MGLGHEVEESASKRIETRVENGKGTVKGCINSGVRASKEGELTNRVGNVGGDESRVK